MAFKYGTTSPTAIKYNGTDLTVLKYGTTAVWGKPYSLSISAGSNTTVTVTRTSSPNQGASTGTLSSGSVVYYGDVLTITASASSGYTLSTFTVNGTSWTSGNTITVTSAVNVVTGATASKSWHTVWTGSTSLSSGVKTSIVTTTGWNTVYPFPSSYRFTIIGTLDGDYTNSRTDPNNATIYSTEMVIEWPDIYETSVSIGTVTYTTEWINYDYYEGNFDENIYLTFTKSYSGSSTNTPSAKVTKVEVYY